MNHTTLKTLSLTTSLALLAACSGKQINREPAGQVDLAAGKMIAPIQYKGRTPASGSDHIPGKFIVTVAPGFDPAEIAKAHGIQPAFIYKHAMNGFAGGMSEVARAGLLRNPNVIDIEQDQKIYANSGTQISPAWGLDRLDQRTLPLDASYTYLSSGAGVTAYVIDTGIRYDHQEFGGDASFGFDAFGGTGADCNGHGTHVSGTIGGTTYGVAKDVKLVAVRVLDCNGSGSNSGVIAGVDWVTANHSGPSVANLSLGGGASSALDLAVHKMAASGVATGVAAGNENKDACNYSPSRTPNVMTIGASTSADARASYSNFGKCIDFFAPGSSITSSWFTNASAINTISGTSMATPHVVGVAALYLEAHPAASAIEVRDALLTYSSKGGVTSAKTTNNHLLYSDESATGTGDYVSPTASMSAPADHSVVAKRSLVTMSAQASDNIAVSKVEFYVNGSLGCTATSSPYSCVYKAPPTAGTLSIQARASDAGGNVIASDPISIKVQ